MAGLLPERQDELLALAPPRTYEADETLVRQGEGSTNVYLLRDGVDASFACVKVTASLSNGAETLLGIRIIGDIVGELATLRELQRTATVTTCTPIVVHPIPQRAFQSFLDRRPDVWQAVCRMVAGRLDWANRRRLDFAGYDVPVRLARVVLELREQLDQNGYQVGVQLTQPELGRLIGAKQDAVGVAIRRLTALGLIEWHYRRVTILDLNGLQQFGDLG
jgi:CRP/FNR family transcriptional regulator, cyclic AMP receptor protein